MHSQVTSADRNPESMSSQVVTTSTLLRCGLAAGPLFLLIFATQILLRPEFRFTRDEPSLLRIGPLGWIQIGNLMLFAEGQGQESGFGLRTFPKSSLLYGMDGKSKFSTPQNYAILLAANSSRSHSCSGMFLSRPQSATPSTTVLALSQTLANVSG